MIGRVAKMFVGALVLAIMPLPSQATHGRHVFTGFAQISGGLWLGIGAALTGTMPSGHMWLVEDDMRVIDIELDCVWVEFTQPTYPMPPHLPYHRVHATGIGTDGERYFITAYDLMAAPLGFGDRATVSTESSFRPCGGTAALPPPILAGDLVAGP